MIRGRGKSVLSTTEIDTLREEREELERSITEGEGYGAGTKGESVDQAAIKRQIANLSQAIIDGTPGKLSGKQKDSLVREVQELEDRFVVGLPTRYEMSHPSKCPGAVRKHLKWLELNEKPGYVDRYREIQRVLNPGEERSIESLRKDK
jgi:hypothetical protein